eukprot:sb/3466730/
MEHYYYIILLLLNFHYCFSYKEEWYAVKLENHANDWVDLVDLREATRSDPLSTEDFAYARRVVDFDFPFYEDSVNQLQVTSTGFLVTGTDNRLDLAESSRYIAPLMGPFSANDVRHYSNSKVFINQWTGLSLRDQPEAGGFTFQVQLHCDGVIKFIYREVPMLVGDINTTAHAVRVGLCDSYEDEDNQLQRYDQLELDMDSVRSNTTFTLTPTPSCGSMKTCSRCLRHSEGCVWCSEIQRTLELLSICAITPVCICITRPARGVLFPHISPLRSKGLICNISSRTNVLHTTYTHKRKNSHTFLGEFLRVIICTFGAGVMRFIISC